MSTNRPRGVTAVEALVALALGLLGIALSAPALASLHGSARAAAGARSMAATFNALRWKSVTLHRARGLRFERTPSGWVWWEVEDGNGNDLRAAEIRDGTDPTRSGPHRLGDLVERARLGFPDSLGSIPEIPPRSGILDGLEDPVRFGRPDLVSFTPGGASSSGTLYVTDGRDSLYAVVLYGPTAKVRVWRYDRWSRRWTR